MKKVTSVQTLDGYRLALSFNEGFRAVLDMTDDLLGEMGTALKDLAFFRQVSVTDPGAVSWPNGFDLCPDALHYQLTGQPPLGLPVRYFGPRRIVATSATLRLRGRTLIALIGYTFASVGAALAMKVEDDYIQKRRGWVRLHEKGGKLNELPCHHTASPELDSGSALHARGQA